MARNKIQIKRSATNSIATLLSGDGLSAGEFAYTSNGNLLYIGDPATSTPLRVGGAMNPGVLTANQALVANSTSAINQIIVANLAITKVSANGEFGTPGYVLATSGTLGNAYWTSSSGFGVDPFASYVWTNTHTFSNSVTFEQTIIGTAYNSTKLGGLDAGQYVNSSYLTSNYQLGGSALSDNVASLTANNSTNLGGQPATYYASNSALNNYYTNSASLPAFIAARAANSASYLGGEAATYFAANSALGNYQTTTGLSANVAKLTANNSAYLGGLIATYYAANSALGNYQTTAGLASNVATLTAYSADRLNGQLPQYYTTNSALSGYVATLTANNTSFVGVSPAASIVNSTALTANLNNYAALSGANFTGVVNAYSYKTGSGYGGALTTGAIVNTTHIAIGNSSVNGYVTANSTNVYFTGVAYNANNTLYLDGRLGSTFADRNEVVALIYDASYGGATQSYVDTKAGAAYTNAVNYTNIQVGYATDAAANAYSNSMNNTLSRSGTYTGNNIFNGSVQTFNSNAVFNNVLTAKDINVTGNLSISGTLTTVNSTELQVKDNSILLADSQASTADYKDTIDFVVYGQFGNTSNTWYSGLYRDANISDSHYSKAVWKLFAGKSGTGGGSVSNSTVNSLTDSETDVNYKLGTLSAYLEPYGAGGRLVANATNISISSNSTFAVNISANSLALSTALTAVNGGTGINSYSVGDIVYATSSSAMTKLSVGTPGQILQISDQNLPRYADLDGGSF